MVPMKIFSCQIKNCDPFRCKRPYKDGYRYRYRIAKSCIQKFFCQNKISFGYLPKETKLNRLYAPSNALIIEGCMQNFRSVALQIAINVNFCPIKICLTHYYLSESEWYYFQLASSTQALQSQSCLS